LSAQPKTYYYVLNLQGDVVKLIDQDGAVAAAYAYDAWGNILSQSGNMAEKNPLRYRGYYYDSETGFYYLQSRYYDPATRRFINADAYASTDSSNAVSCNMFAYCGNNPISAVDPSGEMLITTAILIGAAILGGGAALYVGYKARKAGCGWGETVVRAAASGISVFCSAYTLGMSAYGVYINYCTLNGKIPTTEIGAGTASSADIPKDEYDTYNYVTNHNGSPPKGYRGGREFLNDGRGGAEMLPSEYTLY